MRPSMALLAAWFLPLTACGSRDKTSVGNQSDLGTGLNTVNRQYEKSSTETWDAALSSVKSYDLLIDSDLHDSLGGEIQARRADGDKVIVRVQSLDDRHSDVTVRVDPGNRNMAEMLHEKIAEKLGLKEAKTGWFGGNSGEGIYLQNLDRCVKAAEDAARRLDLTVTNRDIRDGAATVDARETNSNPVRFKLRKVDDKTKVTFIAGREKSERNRELAHNMQVEFENCCWTTGNN
jgi:hypothetical protein